MVVVMAESEKIWSFGGRDEHTRQGARTVSTIVTHHTHLSPAITTQTDTVSHDETANQRRRPVRADNRRRCGATVV